MWNGFEADKVDNLMSVLPVLYHMSHPTVLDESLVCSLFTKFKSNATFPSVYVTPRSPSVELALKVKKWFL